MKAETDGLIQGIKIRRGGQSISHLLYADDVTIFCRASKENAAQVKECLSTFASWTGQEINLQKSYVHFSRNCSPDLRSEICSTLSMPACDHRGKHLGHPFCRTKKSAANFDELIEKLENSLSGWKKNLISQAGRLVLLKHVAQSYPVYCMSTHLLPLIVCNKMDQMMCKFWWNPNASHPMALKSWGSICQPKCSGGLGLRRMKDFNQALLARLPWLIFTNSR